MKAEGRSMGSETKRAVMKVMKRALAMIMVGAEASEGGRIGVMMAMLAIETQI